MDITITKKHHNSLLLREDVVAVIKSSKTPSYTEVAEELSKHLNKEKDLIVIKHVNQKYGQHESLVNAIAYDNKESFNRFEHVNKKEKKKEEKKVKKTE